MTTTLTGSLVWLAAAVAVGLAFHPAAGLGLAVVALLDPFN